MRGKYISINTKLSAILIVVICMFILCSSIVSFIFLRNTLYSNMVSSAQQEFSLAQSSLEAIITNNLNASSIIQQSEEMQELAVASPVTYMEEYTMMTQIEQMVYSVVIPMSLYQISIYVDDSLTFSDNNVVFRPFRELTSYEEYRQLKEGNASYVWLRPEYIYTGFHSEKTEVVSFIRKIGENNDPVGYQRINIKCQDIEKNISIGQIYDAVTFLYSTEKDCLIAVSGQETMKKEDMELFAREHAEKGRYSEWSEVPIGKKGYYEYEEKIRNTDWLMITLIPVDSVMKDAFMLEGMWILIIVLIGVIGLFLGKYLTNEITGRIRRLEHEMEKVERGEFSQVNGENGEKSLDEVDELFGHYNYMILKINEMFEQKTKDEAEKRKLELSVMQAQINPHFLYNTLDLIHWKALELGSTEIRDITMALTNFYRLTLNNGREDMTLKDEIQHIINYIEIQNYRFEHFIKFVYEIPESLMKAKLPKLTLQPLVENAVQHGLMPQENRQDSWIEIYAWKEKDYIVIQISDNGKGMCDSKCRSLLEEDGTDQLHGYGIKNINERLKLYYGSGCGLEIQSKEGKGTVVDVRIREIMLL